MRKVVNGINDLALRLVLLNGWRYWRRVGGIRLWMASKESLVPLLYSLMDSLRPAASGQIIKTIAIAVEPTD